MPRTTQTETIERQTKCDRGNRDNDYRNGHWTEQQFHCFNGRQDTELNFGHDAKAPAEIARETREEAECGGRDIGADGSGTDQAGTMGQELEARLERNRRSWPAR